MTDDDSPYSPPNPAGRGYGWDSARLARIPEYKDEVVRQLKDGVFISAIAEMIDVNPRTIREWRDKDPEFDERCKESETYWTDRVDRDFQMRALHGVAEVVLHPITRQIVMDARYKDPVTGVSTTPLVLMKKNSSDTQFYLRHRRPEVYGEKRTIDANVSMDVEAAAKEFDDKLGQILEKYEK